MEEPSFEEQEMAEALHAAVRGGHGEAVNNLLERGVSVDAEDVETGKTPLHAAAEEGKPEMVQLLLLKEARKDALDMYRHSPLFLAALNGHAAAALPLLSAGANASMRCGEFYLSVLHVAAQEGHVAILRAAVEHGANPNTNDMFQMAPLHYAANYNDTEAIDILVGAGARIDARTQEEATPLHCAAGMLNLEAVTVLLGHGAPVNVSDDDLRTPLHFCVRKAGTGAAGVTDLLLRSGADETRIDDMGRLAADVVAEKVHDMYMDYSEEDVVRVHKLLANAPADRTWRRRGYLLLCRAHPDRVQRAPGPDGQIGGEWAVVMARVLGLEEESVFRTIAGFL